METFCNQLNTNITSLQTIVEALQNKDYVKSVTPIYETNKVIGYTISFEKSGVITIYHGKDGLAGSTPSIGVRQDTDGIYYWTIDGKWMTNEDGDRIPSTGENGPEGTPGITPKFKIENNYWCVSYDNGANWEQLGQATGNKGDSNVEIDIPSSVKEIDGFMFCNNLRKVILHSGVREIRDYAFRFCERLATINFPEGLETIGVRAFYPSNMVRAVFPNSLKRIGAEAFYHNERLLYIKFLSNVSVGDCAFACCPIIRIKKPDDMVFGDKVFVQDTSYDKFAFWD